MTFQTPQIQTVEKFKLLSEKYHKLSLLFYELSRSIELEIKHKNLEHNNKEFKNYLKSLDLDFNKIKEVTKGILNISLVDLKK